MGKVMKLKIYEIVEKIYKKIVQYDFLFFYIALLLIIIFLQLLIRDLCWFGLLNKGKCSFARVPPHDGYYHVGLVPTYIFALISFFIFIKIKKIQWKNIKSKLLSILLLPLITYILNLPVRIVLFDQARDNFTKSAEIDCCRETLRINGNEVMFIDKNQPFCYYRRGEYLKGLSCVFKFKY